MNENNNNVNNNSNQGNVYNGYVMGNANNNQYGQVNGMNTSVSQGNQVNYNNLGIQTNYNSLENTQVLSNSGGGANAQMGVNSQNVVQNNNLSVTGGQIQNNYTQIQNDLNQIQIVSNDGATNLNQTQGSVDQSMMQNGGSTQIGAQGESADNQMNLQMGSQVMYNNDSLGQDFNDNVSKKKNSKLPFILIILIVLGFVVFGIYYFINSSRNMFVVAVDNIFNYLEESTINNATSSGTFSLKMNLNNGDGYVNDAFSVFNNIDLFGNYSIDYENKLASLDIDSNYKNKELINIDAYMDSGNGYVLLEGLYDKYIRIFIDDYDTIFSSYSNKDDYRVVISSINDAIKESLKDEYFTKEKSEFNGDKVDKTVLELNYSNYSAIRKDIYNKLINDEKFLNSFAIIGKMSVNEVKESLDEFNELDSDYEALNIVLFTKGVSFVGVEFSDSSNKVIVSCSDDVYDFEFTEYNDIVLNGTVKFLEDNKVLVKLGVPEENSSVEVTISSTVNYGTKFEKKDVSNNVSSEEITEEDSDSITNNLLEKEGFVSLIQDVYSIDNENIDSDFNM